MKNQFKAYFLLGFMAFNQTSKAQVIPKIGKDTRLEIANWNIEWFGKTTSGYGPEDDAKQQALILQTIQSADIDVWGLCEVSESKAFDSFMLKLPNYAAVLAPYNQEQKTACLYKKDQFTLIRSGLLGTNEKDSFTTGRFPLEIVLLPKQDIGIDTLFIIVLHLKANYGNDSLKMIAYNSRKRSSEWLQWSLNSRYKNRHCAVIGDWNDDLDKSIFNGLPSPFINLTNSNMGFNFISRRLSDANISTTTGYPDPIDHQYISSRLHIKYIQDSTFAWPLDNYIPKYNSTCSDHYPVYSLFNLYSSNTVSVETSKQVKIGPNPTAGTVHIFNLNNNNTVYLTDQSGKTIDVFIELMSDHIAISNLAHGIYILYFISPDNVLTTQKIVVY